MQVKLVYSFHNEQCNLSKSSVYMIFLLFIIFLFSCSTNKATIRTQTTPQNSTEQKSTDSKPQKLVFRSATINAALTNYAITNRPDFQYKTLTQEYQQKYEKTTSLGKEFPVSKINAISASNLMDNVFNSIREKGVGLSIVERENPEGGTGQSREIIGAEKQVLLDILRLALLKDPISGEKYIGIGMLLSGLTADSLLDQDESIAIFMRDNFEYGMVKNKENPAQLGYILPSYIAYAGIGSDDLETIWRDQLSVALYPGDRKPIYCDMLYFYAGNKEEKKLLSLIAEIENNDIEALLEFERQLIPVIFSAVEKIGRDDLVIKFWEKKYKKLYLENMDKKNQSEVASFFVSLKHYCSALSRKNLKEKAKQELDNSKNLGIDFLPGDYDRILRVIR